MSQKEKPKRKNLSPDELLQEARLLYPENEAFVRGESKELHPKATIFANIRQRSKYGFIGDINESTLFVGVILIVPLAIFGNMMLYQITTQSGIIINAINIILGSLFCGSPVFFLGFGLWKMLTFSETRLEHDYISLVKHGNLIFGKAVSVNPKTRFIGFMIYPPNMDIGKFTYWHLDSDISLEEGDKVIILYVDDKLSIVL